MRSHSDSVGSSDNRMAPYNSDSRFLLLLCRHKVLLFSFYTPTRRLTSKKYFPIQKKFSHTKEKENIEFLSLYIMHDNLKYLFAYLRLEGGVSV